MNIDRLNHLKTIMSNVRDANKPFDLGTFINGTPPGEDHAISDLAYNTSGVVGEPDPVCGTTCCALGYAALDPDFRDQGLELVAFSWNSASANDSDRKTVVLKSIPEFNEFINTPEARDFAFLPEFNESNGFAAGSDFFGISTDASFYIFGPDDYRDYDRIITQDPANPITPDEVIKHIDYVLDHEGLDPDEWAAKIASEADELIGEEVC